MNSLLSASEYLTRLTNYSDLRRAKLSFVQAYYDHDCEANIIDSVGFGHGELRIMDSTSTNGRHLYHKYEAPFILSKNLNRNFFRMFTASGLTEFLTFSWFADNVICFDQPWICS